MGGYGCQLLGSARPRVVLEKRRQGDADGCTAEEKAHTLATSTASLCHSSLRSPKAAKERLRGGPRL